MNEVIQRLVDKAGLSEEQATNAVNLVVQFLDEHLPGPVASQIDSLMSGAGTGGMADKLGGIGASIGGMFGKRE
jgi:hypothetical protein